jgi:hypothetical protein
MYTGTVINDLMEMVARAEGHAQNQRRSVELERDEELLASHFAYQPVDSRPLMSGVA